LVAPPRADRPAASRQEALAGLLEFLLEVLTLDLQRVGGAEDTRGPGELLLPLDDLVGDGLTIDTQGHPRPQVHHAESRKREHAEDDALVAPRVPGVPALQAAEHRLEPCAERAHRTTSATIEKRSLSPCLVVGDAKLTFLNRF